MTISSFKIINNKSELNELTKHLENNSVLAVDTEFMRTDTFFPKLALLQIAVSGKQYLIDPLLIEDLDILKPVILENKPLKIFHACGEDLEVFKTFWNQIPGSLFDTQIAAAFLGYGLQCGYQKLLKELLGIEIDKSETRSDWCQRPLSEKQLQYAALDVEYLENMYDILCEELEKKLRLSWVEEDCNALLSAASIELKPEHYYQKFNHVWRLDLDRQNLLQILCEWRENQARSRDKPRSFIISDKDLLLIVQAKTLPENKKALINLGLHPRAVKREGEDILGMMAKSRHNKPLIRRLLPPLPASVKPLIADLKKATRERAEQLQLPFEVLANRKQTETFIFSSISNGIDNLSIASEWRNEVLGSQWLEIVHKNRELIKDLRNYYSM